MGTWPSSWGKQNLDQENTIRMRSRKPSPLVEKVIMIISHTESVWWAQDLDWQDERR